jgi:hypothetical protein
LVIDRTVAMSSAKMPTVARIRPPTADVTPALKT